MSAFGIVSPGYYKKKPSTMRKAFVAINFRTQKPVKIANVFTS